MLHAFKELRLEKFLINSSFKQLTVIRKLKTDFWVDLSPAPPLTR